MYQYQIHVDNRIAAKVWDVQDMAVQQTRMRGWSNVRVAAGTVSFQAEDKPRAVEALLIKTFPTLAKGLTLTKKPMPKARVLKGLYGLNEVPARTDFE